MGTKRFTSDVYNVGELAFASGARQPQIEGWSRNGILIPYKDSNGFGSRRVFKGAIPILDATEARELTAAGYSYRQILRRFTEHRAALATLPPEQRVVARFRRYIATIVQLSELFGKGDGFDVWHAAQQAQLARMEKAIARDGDRAPDGSARAINVLTLGAPADGTPPKALAG
jgi:DNA-binding transcriptional MerR regulator